MQNLKKVVLLLRASPTINFAVRIIVCVIFPDVIDVSPVAGLRVAVYIRASLSGRDPKEPEQIDNIFRRAAEVTASFSQTLGLTFRRFLAQALSGFGLTMSRFSKQKRPSVKLFCKFGQSGAGLLRSREKVPMY